MCGNASYYNNVFKDMNIAAKPLAPPVADGARDYTISICKGIAIILMVVGHVEAPELLTNFIYTFHMPLFFIAAGYFFSRKWLDRPWEFCVRRVKGLYVPFLTWALVFWALHNVLFYFGVLNEQYGNWTGGVTHPYSWDDAAQRLINIVFSMSGYDEFLAGAFWFFRGLLVASILFLILYKLLDGCAWLRGDTAVVLICVIALAFTAFRIFFNARIQTIPNGGMREIWGLFFFGAGYLMCRYGGYVPRRWWLTLALFGLMCLAAVLHLCGMNNSGTMRDVLTLPLTGLIGFIVTYRVSAFIHAGHLGVRLRRLLVYIGENTLYIFIFHIVAFKVVSLLKILYYDLDWGQMGCHMVIHYNHLDFFWVLYSVAGVALPLLGLEGVRRLRRRLRKA